MQFAKKTRHNLHSTLYTPHRASCTLTLYTLHFTLDTPRSTCYAALYTARPHTPNSTLYRLHFTVHSWLRLPRKTAFHTRRIFTKCCDCHAKWHSQNWMEASHETSIVRLVVLGLFRNELVGKPWFGATECENLIKFEDVSHEMLVLRLQHLSSRFFGFLVVYMGKAAKTCHFISMVSNRLQCRFCTAVFFITSHKIHLKIPRLPRILHFATNWRSLRMRYSKKTRDATRLKCCACKMAMEDSKVLRRAAPATKNPTQLLKTTEKHCVCHTERLWTRYETCWNVTKCHACHAKSHAVFETSI